MCHNLQYCINQKINQLFQKLCTNIKYKQRKIKNSEEIRKPVMDTILIGCILNIAKMQKMSPLVNSPLFSLQEKIFFEEKKQFSLQNITSYAPIDRSRRAELKYIIFYLIWTFFHVKKFKKLSLKSQIRSLRSKINRIEA